MFVFVVDMGSCMSSPSVCSLTACQRLTLVCCVCCPSRSYCKRCSRLVTDGGAESEAGSEYAPYDSEQEGEALSDG